jgi:hypothetical protein
MTTNHHTAIATGAAANAAIINSPLEALDAVIPKNASGEGVSVDADGTVTIKLGDNAGVEKVSITDSGDNEVLSITSEGQVKAKAYGSPQDDIVLADDTATSFVPVADSGIIVVAPRGGSYKEIAGVVNYRASSSPYAFIVAQGSGGKIEITTGVLTGTTGTDTKFTVSAASDGTLYFENRLGFSVIFDAIILGA